MEIYFPKGGDWFSLCIKKRYRAISFGNCFRYSTVAGFTLRKPRIPLKIDTALLRFYELVALDQMPRVSCQKCIKYPIEFHTSIIEGNELQYSGYYHRSLLDILLRRKK